MHRLLRFLVLTILIGLPFAASAAPGADCRQRALAHLKAASPDGFAIYSQVKHPDFFGSWLDCDDAQFDLSTAVHESTHFISGETDAFPLVGGGAIARPHEVSAFFPPVQIAPNFKGDDFAGIYLKRGKASSATDFLYLLDELNAYAHDLNAAIDLRGLTATDQAVDHRDGLAAMMTFVMTYAETARAREPETWRGLREPAAARTVSVLWRQGERVMAASCGIPNFGNVDKAYIRRVCAAGPRSAMAEILGRAPVCPAACLTPDVEPASASGETRDESEIER